MTQLESFSDRIKHKGFTPSRINVKTSGVRVSKTPLRLPEGYNMSQSVSPVSIPERPKPKFDHMDHFYHINPDFDFDSNSEIDIKIQQLLRFQRNNELSDNKMKELILNMIDDAEPTIAMQYVRISKDWINIRAQTESKLEARTHDMRPSSKEREDRISTGKSLFL